MTVKIKIKWILMKENRLLLFVGSRENVWWWISEVFIISLWKESIFANNISLYCWHPLKKSVSVQMLSTASELQSAFIPKDIFSILSHSCRLHQRSSDSLIFVKYPHVISSDKLQIVIGLLKFQRMANNRYSFQNKEKIKIKTKFKPQAKIKGKILVHNSESSI